MSIGGCDERKVGGVMWWLGRWWCVCGWWWRWWWGEVAWGGGEWGKVESGVWCGGVGGRRRVRVGGRWWYCEEWWSGVLRSGGRRSRGRRRGAVV